MNSKRLITILLFLLTSAALCPAQWASEQCVANKNAPPVSLWYWAPDTTVKLYFVQNMFTPEQQQALIEAIQTWNAVAEETGAGVRYQVMGFATGIQDCASCLTVTRGDIHGQDKDHYAFFYPTLNETGLISYAWICFDFKITSAEALRSFMVHEMGHGMGLWDCPTCENHMSIMRGFPGINKDNGLTAPSPCDMQTVKLLFGRTRKLIEGAAARLNMTVSGSSSSSGK
jgi:hypothetical protein